MRRNKNKRIILLLSLVLLIMTIGFTAFSSGLKINESAYSDLDWNVYIKSITVSHVNGRASGEGEVKERTSAELITNLVLPGDFVEYTIVVANDGSVDAVLDVITLTATNPDSVIKYSYDGIEEDETLLAETEKEFIVKVEYDPEKTGTALDSQKKNSLTLDLDYVQKGHETIIKDFTGYYVYNVVAEDAVMDNVASSFVSNPSGIDFYETSSTSNGTGNYIFSETVNDEFPTYYYRGDVKNNNVIFANYCWKILRTTSTGGTKLIYNGVPVNGKCDNHGADTLTHTKVVWDYTSKGLSTAGYSHTDESKLVMSAKADSDIKAGIIFSSDVKYQEVYDETTGTSSWKYVLTGDKVTSTANYAKERENLLKEHHYTCLSDTLESCDAPYYFYMVRNSSNYYARLRNGQLLNDLLNIEFNGGSTNKTKSNIHTVIEQWYDTHLVNYGNQIEDTVYCNDRTLYNQWSNSSSVANENDDKTHFGAKARAAYTGGISVDCIMKSDSFTVSPAIGNGVLKYPIGLITFDEAVLAGYAWDRELVDNFLYNDGYVWWSMSPGFISAVGIYMGVIYSTLDHVAVNYTSGNAGGVRPVISLKYGSVVEGGKGSVDEPFIIE